MNEKLHKEELRNILKRKYGMSEREAADALNKFFSLLTKALEGERYVKIKGLGIFKLIDVESRKSVDVNTGLSVEIPEHRKVSFSVDSSLKELINKPFAHFETVELRDDSPLVESADDTASDSSEELPAENPAEPSVEEPSDTITEQPLEVPPAKEEVAEPLDDEPSEEMDIEEPATVECALNEEKSEPSDNNGRERLLTRREGWRELEMEVEREERNNKIALFTISFFMFLLMLAGLLFILAPEFLEKLFY